MAAIFGFETGLNMPTISTAGWGGTITLILAVIFIFILIGVGIWIWFQNRLFNRKIIIYENIAGQGYQITGRDTARIVKIGDGGEELLFLRKRKVYRTAYGRKMGLNTYWFAVGQDGYWYNIVLGDLDAKMGMLDIEPIDRDMRYMHVAIRKNIQERYRKTTFAEKYGQIIVSGIFMIIMVIAVWMLMSKAGDLITSSTTALNQIKPLVDTLTQAVSKLDTICSFSGVRTG
jgi:hypothetical protein